MCCKFGKSTGSTIGYPCQTGYILFLPIKRFFKLNRVHFDLISELSKTKILNFLLDQLAFLGKFSQ